MTARDKTSRFTTKAGTEMRDGVIRESAALFEMKPVHGKRLATASQRFAAVLRAALIDETTKSGEGDFGRALLIGEKRPLWTTRLESGRRRYVEQLMLKASTAH